MGFVLIPRNWKKYIFHRGLAWNFLSVLGNELIPGGNEKDKARQAVFLTPLNPFGHDPEEEPHFDCTVPQRVSCVTPVGNTTKMQCTGYDYQKAQDQGLEFWQTKSFVIMTYATISGDCIDRVTSQNGDRVNFERLETPRPHPRQRGERLGMASSSSSIPLPAQTYPAPGNWGQKGRTKLEHKTLRTTPQKRTSPPGNWCIPLRTWMWMLISATKKSARVHSCRML